MNEFLYEDYLKDVKGLLIRFGVDDDPADYINDAWLELFEAGKSFTWKNVYSFVINRLHIEKKQERKKWDLSKETYSVCKKCNGHFPCANFYLVYDKILDLKLPYKWCKECSRKYQKSYSLLNPRIGRIYKPKFIPYINRPRKQRIVKIKKEKAIIENRFPKLKKAYIISPTDDYFKDMISNLGYTGSINSDQFERIKQTILLSTNRQRWPKFPNSEPAS